jgi:hypothetical protein
VKTIGYVCQWLSAVLWGGLWFQKFDVFHFEINVNKLKAIQ